MKKILVVGSGLSGSVISRKLAETDKYLVFIVEKRNEIGGNVYDYENSKGIRIHKYGPHLFHTNNKKVVDFIKKYAEWIPYKHKVKAILKNGDYVTLPVNRETKKIVGQENIIETFFRPYSEKMWGIKLEELSPDILKRIPSRDDDNEYYSENHRKKSWRCYYSKLKTLKFSTYFMNIFIFPKKKTHEESKQCFITCQKGTLSRCALGP